MRVRIARLEYRPLFDTWAVSFAYNEELIGALKVTVPYNGRTWLPAERVWVIEARYIDAVRALLGAHGLTIRETSPGSSSGRPSGAPADGGAVYWQEQCDTERKLREQAQAGLVAKTRELADVRRELAKVRMRVLNLENGGGRASSSNGGSWARQLRSAVPNPLQDKVYKALLRVLHPDTGGSTELTKELNAEFRR